MATRGILALILVVALVGPASGQGLFESILGPGGLGIWGGGAQYPQAAPQQFNNPQFYGGQQYPGQVSSQNYPPQTGSYSYGQPGQGYPQQPYRTESGLYADWYQYPPAVPGAEPSTQPYGPPAPPPTRYVAPPAPAPQQYQSQAPTPQRQLRPGQYSPRQGPPQGAEDLPPGAVRVTTTTPEGTTVQYYPPRPGPESQQGVTSRQPRPRRAAAPQTRPSRTQSNQGRSQPATSQRPSAQYSSSSVAMPQPVQIPTDRDPRSGWEAAVDRTPSTPADNL